MAEVGARLFCINYDLCFFVFVFVQMCTYVSPKNSRWLSIRELAKLARDVSFWKIERAHRI